MSRYGIIVCQMDYFFIDGVAVLSLGYTMNLSNPQKKLRKVRLGFKQVDLCASDIVDALFIVTDVGKLSIYLSLFRSDFRRYTRSQ